MSVEPVTPFQEDYLALGTLLLMDKADTARTLQLQNEVFRSAEHIESLKEDWGVRDSQTAKQALSNILLSGHSKKPKVRYWLACFHQATKLHPQDVAFFKQAHKHWAVCKSSGLYPFDKTKHLHAHRDH